MTKGLTGPNKDAWKDKFRFLVLIVECIIEFTIYSIPYSPIPLETDLKRVSKHKIFRNLILALLNTAFSSPVEKS